MFYVGHGWRCLLKDEEKQALSKDANPYLLLIGPKELASLFLLIWLGLLTLPPWLSLPLLLLF